MQIRSLLEQERLATVRTHVEQSSYSDVDPSDLLDYPQRPTRGKLNGYIDTPERTLNHHTADEP